MIWMIENISSDIDTEEVCVEEVQNKGRAIFRQFIKQCVGKDTKAKYKHFQSCSNVFGFWHA